MNLRSLLMTTRAACPQRSGIRPSLSWLSCCLIKTSHRLNTVPLFCKEAPLPSRKSSWKAGMFRLMKLKPRVGRHRPVRAAASPEVRRRSMLLFPAPSRPRTRTWRFPRSSSSWRPRIQDKHSETWWLKLQLTRSGQARQSEADSPL